MNQLNHQTQRKEKQKTFSRAEDVFDSGSKAIWWNERDEEGGKGSLIIHVTTRVGKLAPMKVTLMHTEK